jgi:hypothetical protein
MQGDINDQKRKTKCHIINLFNKTIKKLTGE